MGVLGKIVEHSHDVVEAIGYLWRVRPIEPDDLAGGPEQLIAAQALEHVSEITGPAGETDEQREERRRATRGPALAQILADPAGRAWVAETRTAWCLAGVVAVSEILDPPEWEDVSLCSSVDDEDTAEGTLWLQRIPIDDQWRIVAAVKGLHSAEYRRLLRQSRHIDSGDLRCAGGPVRPGPVALAPPGSPKIGDECANLGGSP